MGMSIRTGPSVLSGAVDIPGSKSHTIRAFILALLAEGACTIRRPLYSADTLSCVNSIRRLGARSAETGEDVTIIGTGGRPVPPDRPIDVGNSGTTLRLLTAAAAHCTGPVTFTGDRSVQSRPMGPLLDALAQLGVSVQSDNGRPPFTVRGPLHGGTISLACPSSQYLSALLLALPLAEGDSVISVTELAEAPYIDMTLRWMESVGLEYSREKYGRFSLPGGQTVRPFTTTIPADFSTMAFPLVAAVLRGREVVLRGLDLNDCQGDKKILDYFRAMGADIDITGNDIKISAAELTGVELDLNETPDALPVMATAACFAKGRTVIRNVAQARIKETDRIRVMTGELRRLGADVTEQPDGMVITSSRLTGGRVNGHHDHRVVMALACAGLAVEGGITVETADAAAVTYPGFVPALRSLGADIEEVEES
jgi:3-phosphoshikimate 1-carboxyvinyltransferase